jgi:hypothetical protein
MGDKFFRVRHDDNRPGMDTGATTDEMNEIWRRSSTPLAAASSRSFGIRRVRFLVRAPWQNFQRLTVEDDWNGMLRGKKKIKKLRKKKIK